MASGKIFLLNRSTTDPTLFEQGECVFDASKAKASSAENHSLLASMDGTSTAVNAAAQAPLAASSAAAASLTPSSRPDTPFFSAAAQSSPLASRDIRPLITSDLPAHQVARILGLRIQIVDRLDTASEPSLMLPDLGGFAYFWGLNVTDDEAVIIASAMSSPRWRNIQYLDFAEQPIGDRGAAAFESVQTVRILNFSHCQVGDEGAIALGRNRGLDSVDLTYNRVGNRGALGLGKSQSIRRYYLAHNQIDDAGMTEFLKNTRMLVLDIEQIDGLYETIGQLNQRIDSNKQAEREERECRERIAAFTLSPPHSDGKEAFGVLPDDFPPLSFSPIEQRG